jgi:hypothetical protein
MSCICESYSPQNFQVLALHVDNRAIYWIVNRSSLFSLLISESVCFCSGCIDSFRVWDLGRMSTVSRTWDKIPEDYRWIEAPPVCASAPMCARAMLQSKNLNFKFRTVRYRSTKTWELYSNSFAYMLHSIGDHQWNYLHTQFHFIEKWVTNSKYTEEILTCSCNKVQFC